MTTSLELLVNGFPVCEAGGNLHGDDGIVEEHGIASLVGCMFLRQRRISKKNAMDRSLPNLLPKRFVDEETFSLYRLPQT